MREGGTVIQKAREDDGTVEVTGCFEKGVEPPREIHHGKNVYLIERRGKRVVQETDCARPAGRCAIWIKGDSHHRKENVGREEKQQRFFDRHHKRASVGFHFNVMMNIVTIVIRNKVSVNLYYRSKPGLSVICNAISFFVSSIVVPMLGQPTAEWRTSRQGV